MGNIAKKKITKLHMIMHEPVFSVVNSEYKCNFCGYYLFEYSFDRPTTFRNAKNEIKIFF